MVLQNVSQATIGMFILMSKGLRQKKWRQWLDIKKLVIFQAVGISGEKILCGEVSIRKEEPSLIPITLPL